MSRGLSGRQQRDIARMAPEVRQRLAADFEEQYDDVVAALKDAMKAELEQPVDIRCRKCGQSQRARVPVPDRGARLRAIELWSAMGLGKPSTQKPEETRPAGSLTLEAIESMSLEQLAAVAEMAPVDEGEL